MSRRKRSKGETGRPAADTRRGRGENPRGELSVGGEASEDERRRLLAEYAEIATLAGGLAHEIRNPLSTISMNVDLMAESLEGAETPRERRLQRQVEIVKRECSHLEDVLGAFLQFARVGELECEQSCLNELVREFIEFYRPQAAEKRIDISPHLDADLPLVNIDRALIRQVLMNLALNAQQAMPEGGTLELQTYSGNGRVCLEIIDTGCGMDERTRERMFQTFFSTKTGGSGLGLPTVRKIVEAHGGAIECQSALGRGTRFTIMLPAAGGRMTNAQ